MRSDQLENNQNDIQPENEDLAVDENQDSGKKVYTFLKKTGFLEFRKDEEKFEEWIKELTLEEFTGFLTRLNGIIREKPIKDRSVDGGQVEIGSITIGTEYLPPDESQKPQLLEKVFNSIKGLDETNDRALLAYYSIQALHLFEDGNGRTARLLYELLNNPQEKIDVNTLSLFLNHKTKDPRETGQGRRIFGKKVEEPKRASYFINREIAKQIFGQDFISRYGAIYVNGIAGVFYGNKDLEEQLELEKLKRTKKVMSEEDVYLFPTRGIVLYRLIQETPELEQYLYIVSRNPYNKLGPTPEDQNKIQLGIDLEEMEPNLTPKQALRALEIHGEVKEQFIETLIDLFENPNEHNILDQSGETVAIKNQFTRL